MPNTRGSIPISRPSRSPWRCWPSWWRRCRCSAIAPIPKKSFCRTRSLTSGAYYQAKNIRLHTDELFADLAGVVASKDAESAAKLQEKVHAEADRYKDEKKELETKAHELEQEFALTHRKADRFDLGEVFLEIALVITSITLLSGRRIFWHLGLLLAAAGILSPLRPGSCARVHVPLIS